MSVCAEVRVTADGEVVMTAADFRAIMADLEAAEATRDALDAALATERARVDEYMLEVESLRAIMAIERDAFRSARLAATKDKFIWGFVGALLGAVANN